MKCVWFTAAALWAGPLSAALWRPEVSHHLHKTFHWPNGEGAYAHCRISWFSLVWITRFQGERADGEECVCVCVRGAGWGGSRLSHDSLAWIKCGTLIWVKIMESYMSLNTSAFSRRLKWKVTTGHSRGGRRGCWNENWVTTRPLLRLNCNQTEAELTVIQHGAAKNSIGSLACLYAFVYLTT